MAEIYKTAGSMISIVEIMTTTPATPANGQYTDNGRPKGFSSLTPFIALKDPKTAISFYTDVFGARVINSTVVEDVIVHAEIEFAFGRLQLGVAQAAYHLIPVEPDAEDSQFSLGIYVPNVDATLATAVAHGASLREPAQTFVSGDRYGSIRDPFGIRWSIMTRVEDLSEEESSRRIEAWAADQESSRA